MKQNFKMFGKSETKVRIQVQIESPKYILTRGEVSQKKTHLQNEIHRVLRDFGYDVKEIQIQ